MFENLTESLSKSFNSITNKTKINDKDIRDVYKDVKKSLLNADVSWNIVKQFMKAIHQEVVGKKIVGSLTPGQEFIKIVNKELISLMGESNSDLNIFGKNPSVILVVGLQGSGKTTTIAKLVNKINHDYEKSVMVVSCDVYRPAAIDQLKNSVLNLNCIFFNINSDDPYIICRDSIIEFKNSRRDVLIVDTAGRFDIDNHMMNEIKVIYDILSPSETLFVVDSMTGQNASKTAVTFNDFIPLTGVILTKIDGDSRGGAALSIRYLIKKPIKFLGTGEKITDIEPFHPKRIASRILGMGDILSLIEDIEKKVDKNKVKEISDKVSLGDDINLFDFKNQLQQMVKVGGVNSFVDKFPGMNKFSKFIDDKVDKNIFLKMISVIDSMTFKERKFPDLIRGSRKKRIALGSGNEIKFVNKVLKYYFNLSKMMKKFHSKDKINNLYDKLKTKLS